MVNGAGGGGSESSSCELLVGPNQLEASIFDFLSCLRPRGDPFPPLGRPPPPAGEDDEWVGGPLAALGSTLCDARAAGERDSLMRVSTQHARFFHPMSPALYVSIHVSHDSDVDRGARGGGRCVRRPD